MQKIPFLDLSYIHDEIKNNIKTQICEVIDKNYFILGDKLSEFENSFAKFSGVKHSFGVANGLDAIILSLEALGVGIGDEVIVPAHTFVATWNAVAVVGATPIPVEVELETGNIDPKRIEEKITDKTKAIIPVHLYGQMCNMQAVMEVANKHNIKVIEDNAQSVGAFSEVSGKAGSIGHINATSFYPGKNLGAFGDAGAITTNDTELAEKVMLLRNYGSKVKYVHEMIGRNSRMDEMQAAVLNIKLGYIDSYNESRRKVASYYFELLSDLPIKVFSPASERGSHVYHLFCILCEKRDELQKYLAENGIDTIIHYPIPPHLQKAYKYLNYSEDDFSITEKISKEVLSLPMYPGLIKSQVEYIAEKINFFYRR